MQNSYAVIYLVIINAVTFLVYGSDKHKAIKNKWRIPEKSLLLLALVGGSAGAVLGMQVFRHKTKKPLFKYGVPIILMLHIGLLIK